MTNLPDLDDIVIISSATILDSLENRPTFYNDTLLWNDSAWEAEYQEYLNDSTATLKPDGELIWYPTNFDNTELGWEIDGAN